jgi:hypothetical protein
MAADRPLVLAKAETAAVQAEVASPEATTAAVPAQEEAVADPVAQVAGAVPPDETRAAVNQK